MDSAGRIYGLQTFAPQRIKHSHISGMKGGISPLRRGVWETSSLAGETVTYRWGCIQESAAVPYATLINQGSAVVAGGPL